VASFIHAPTACALTNHTVCPCWPLGPAQLEDETLLGPPKTTAYVFLPEECDTDHHVDYNPSLGLIDQSAEAGPTVDADVPFAAAVITTIQSPRTLITFCFTSNLDGPIDDIKLSEAEACMQDILDYCRDYCKYNPIAQCQKRSFE
jgi:hypothetical protein